MRPLRVQHRAMSAGQAGVDRLPHAEPGGRRARRDGLRGASPRVTELLESSEDGQAGYTGLPTPGRRAAGCPARRGYGLSGVGFLREVREKCLSTGHYLSQVLDFIEMVSGLL